MVQWLRRCVQEYILLCDIHDLRTPTVARVGEYMIKRLLAAVLQAAARLCPEAVRKALLAPDSKGRLPFAPARRSDNGREVNRLFAQFRETADRDTEADD